MRSRRCGGYGVAQSQTAAVNLSRISFVRNERNEEDVGSQWIGGHLSIGRCQEGSDAVINHTGKNGLWAGLERGLRGLMAATLLASAGVAALVPTVAMAQPAQGGSATAAENEIDSVKVYRINLTGWFGEDISQTPINLALKDAQKSGAELIVVYIDNDWSLRRFGQLDEIKDDVGQFDQIQRAMDIVPEFNEKLRTWWPDHPKIVFWVKTAMGGSCFVPLTIPEIYMHSEGKLGGIGHMSKAFGQMGSERVREKQYSLRMAWAEGLGNLGGYDGRILRAMARDEYVLSYKMEGGKPVFLERMPQAPDEVLLTDNGEEANEDNIEQLARGQGNDCLTLRPDVARELGVSKATVDSFEDLMHELGIARTFEFVESSTAADVKAKKADRGSGRSDQIMKQWREGIVSAKRNLQKLWREFNETPVDGDFDERRKGRSTKMRKIDEMRKLLKQYEEAINPNEIRVPGDGDLLVLRKQIELDQLADKK